MPEDKAWERIVDAIDLKYGLIKHSRGTRPVPDASDLTEQVASVIFERAGEQYKLERVQGPAIIDRRTVGARRAGATTHIENIYDPTQTSLRTNVFRHQAGEWVAIGLDELGL